MSMPRIALAAARSSSGGFATLMPPALPRPPTCTSDLTASGADSDVRLWRGGQGRRGRLSCHGEVIACQREPTADRFETRDRGTLVWHPLGIKLSKHFVEDDPRAIGVAVAFAGEGRDLRGARKRPGAPDLASQPQRVVGRGHGALFAPSEQHPGEGIRRSETVASASQEVGEAYGLAREVVGTIEVRALDRVHTQIRETPDLVLRRAGGTNTTQRLLKTSGLLVQAAGDPNGLGGGPHRVRNELVTADLVRCLDRGLEQRPGHGEIFEDRDGRRLPNEEADQIFAWADRARPRDRFVELGDR